MDINLDALGDNIIAIAAVAAALGVLWRFLGINKLLGGTRMFLDDWNGEPARPGRPATPSFPERMSKVEERTAALNHDLRGELTSRLILLEGQLDAVQDQTKELKRNGGSHLADDVAKVVVGVDELKDSIRSNREAVQAVDIRLTETDRRISDHRRRNEEQMTELRREIERRLETSGGDHVRTAAYQAILHELGFGKDKEGPSQIEHFNIKDLEA